MKEQPQNFRIAAVSRIQNEVRSSIMANENTVLKTLANFSIYISFSYTYVDKLIYVNTLSISNTVKALHYKMQLR
jgi:hypothetical protein